MLLLCMPSAVLLNLQSLRVSPTIHSDHFITKECFIVIILVLLCLCITQYKNLIYRLVTEEETGWNFLFFHWDHLSTKTSAELHVDMEWPVRLDYLCVETLQARFEYHQQIGDKINVMLALF